MRIVVLLATTLLLSIVNGYAQDSSRSPFSVTFTFPILSNSYGIEPGIEYRFSKHWSGFSELAIAYSKMNDRFDKIRSLRTNAELRWYYGKSDGSYFSLQGGHNFRTFYSYKDGKYYDRLYSDTAYTYSSARIKSPVTTLALLFGEKLFTENRFYLDMSLGMGVRFISTTYYADNVVKGVDSKPTDNWGMFVPNPAFNCNCNLTRFHASIALRAGWMF